MSNFSLKFRGVFKDPKHPPSYGLGSHSIWQGLRNGSVSIRPSVPCIDCRSSMRWVCRRAPCGQAMSIHCCTAHLQERCRSSKCDQSHIHSCCRRQKTDLLLTTFVAVQSCGSAVCVCVYSFNKMTIDLYTQQTGSHIQVMFDGQVACRNLHCSPSSL